MPRIRLLAAVPGDGPVAGRRGAVVEVDAATAREWADGVRAERVVDRTPPVERAVDLLGGRERR